MIVKKMPKAFRYSPERIKQMREDLGLSWQRCASAMGVTPPMLKNWENGKPMSYRSAMKIRIFEERVYLPLMFQKAGIRL